MSEETKKANWVKVGTINSSSDDASRLYVQMNHFKGTVLFLEKETNTVYKLNSASIRAPFDNDPPFVQKVLSVNLDNEKSREVLDLEELIASLMASADMNKLSALLKARQTQEQSA